MADKESNILVYRKAFKIHNFVVSMNPLGWIYIVSIIESILYLWYAGIYAYNDTWSYLEAWQVIKTGHISVFRTPLYPIILGVFYEIFGQHGVFWATTLLQYSILFISIKYYYLTTVFFIKQPIWRYTVCYLYILHPMLFQWASFMYTEALSMAGIIFLFYVLVRIWEGNPKIIHIINLFLIPFLLMMLRPAFIYLYPLLFIFLFFLIKKERKISKYVICALLSSSLLVLGYGYIFKQNFGIFGFSSVSSINQAYILKYYNVWEDSLPLSSEEKNMMERRSIYDEESHKSDLSSEEYFKLINEGKLNSYHARFNNPNDLVPFNNLVTKQIKNNPIEYIKTIYLRICESHRKSILPPYSQKFDYYILEMITPSYNTYWLLFIFFSIFLFFFYHKFHYWPTLTIFIFLTVILGIFTAIVGAGGEWHRLSMPSIPLALIMLGIILDSFKIAPLSHLP